MKTTAWRCIDGRWWTVSATQVMVDKKPGEWFRDIHDFNLFLRHHGGRVTPHFEIEPRWNREQQK